MKKLNILLLIVVIFISVSAVSATDANQTDDLSSYPDDVNSDFLNVDDAALSADKKNFTTLQNEIDSSSGVIIIDSDYVRAEGENDIIINKNINIRGNGQYTIDANNLGGIFKINEGSAVMLMKVVLINANGGAIDNEGFLTISNCKISNSIASTGGAIYNKGFASISASTFDFNRATISGGAIYNEATLDIDNSQFMRNNASAIFSISQSILSISKSTFSDNNASYKSGGAIYLVDVGEISIVDSIFDSNSAYKGGAIKLQNITKSVKIKNTKFNSNSAIEGGAININNSSMELDGCNFNNNSASAGGAAIFSKANITVCNSDFDENTGGAIVSFGNLYLQNNNISSIHSWGNISSKVTIEILNNDSVDNWNETAKITAKITDDNENPIEYIGLLKFTINGHTVNATYNAAEKSYFYLFNPPESGVYIVSAEYLNNNADVKKGIVKNYRGSFTDLQQKINSMEKLILEYDFRYSMELDGDGFISGVVITQVNTAVNGNGHIIDGNGLSNIFNITADANLVNISFINSCEVIFVSSHVCLTIENSTFDNNTEVAVYNLGHLFLKNNNISKTSAKIITRGGVVASSVNIIILEGEVKTINDFNVKLYAVISDDNGNKIDDDGFNFTINDDEVKATYNRTSGLFEAYCTLYSPGFYHVNIRYSGDDLNIENATLKVIKSTFTDLQNRISDMDVLNLSYDFTYFSPIDGDKFLNGILINKSIIINGNDHIIDAYNSSTVFSITAENVEINRISLVNSPEAVRITGSSVSISDSEFKFNSIGILLNGSDVSVVSCDFTNNTDCAVSIYDSNVVLKNSTLKDLIFLNTGNLSLKNNKINKDNALIYNINGSISNVTVTVSSNRSMTGDLGSTVKLNLTLMDDSGNLIYYAQPLKFIINDKYETDAVFISYKSIYKADFTIHDAGLNIISVNYPADNIGTAVYNVAKANATFTLNISDIVFGENATVHLCLFGVNSTGLNATNVSVILNNKQYYVNITDGEANLVVNGLNYGSYPVFAIFGGDANYEASYASEVFFTKGISVLSVENITDITYEDTIELNIQLKDTYNNNLTGIVNITLGVKNYQLLVENGKGTLVIRNLDAGSYTADARYDGSNSYTSCTNNNVSFTVNPKKIYETDIDTSVVVDYESSMINITIRSVDAEYTVEIDSNKYNISVLNGRGHVIIRNLESGVKKAKFTLISNNYVSTNFTKEFTYKSNPKFDAVFNWTYPQLNITVSGNTGKYNVSVCDESFEITINDKDTSLQVRNLTADVYKINITFIENDEFISISKIYEFKIEKTNPKFNVSVISGTYLDGVIFTIRGDNGIYLIGDKQIILTDGENSTVMTLNAGEYNNVNVTFKENGNFNELTKKVNFTVLKSVPTINLSLSNVTYPGSAVINLSSNIDGEFIVQIGDQKQDAVLKADTLKQILLSNLNAGEYDVNVSYCGNNNFNSTFIKTTLKVFKAPSAIFINDILNTTYPNIIKINYTAFNASNIIVKIFNEDLEEISYTIDNNGVISVSEVPGRYTINITIPETLNYLKYDVIKSFTINKLSDYPRNISLSNVLTTQNATVIITLPVNIEGEISVEINNKTYNTAIIRGVSKILLDKLPADTYPIKISYSGDNYYDSFENITFLTVKKTDNYEIKVNSTSPVFGENATLTVKLPDNATGYINITAANKKYNLTLDGGEACLNISSLPLGDNNVVISYGGDADYSEGTVNLTVHVRGIFITVKNIKRGYKSGADYIARVVDEYSNPLSGVAVNVIIDSKGYDATSNSDGYIEIDANLGVGSYNALIVNPLTRAVLSNKITIVPRIVQHNFNMDYGDGSVFKAQIFDGDGKAVGAGVTVNVNMAGSAYKLSTDSNGYVTLKITKSPGSYVISFTYAGITVTSKINIKHLLKASKVTVRKSSSNKIIKATLKHSNGKTLKGQVVNLNFAGKTFKAKSNSKGIVNFKITKKTINKLKAGKNYTMKFTYKSDVVTKVLNVKK